MNIEHIALYVKDLEKTREFYIKYFNAVSNEMYHNVKTGFKSYFLSFESGARLEIMNKPDVLKNDNVCSFGYAHLAFSVGSKEKVDALTERLKNDGYCAVSCPRTTGDGYYESCVLDSEGNQIEITV